MAYISPEELRNASVDAGTLEKFALGGVGEPNINRVGSDVANLATIADRVLRLGDATPYETLEALQRDSDLPSGAWATVLNDPDVLNNGLYIKEAEGLSKTVFQPAEGGQVINALLRSVGAQQTWVLPNRKFDLSDPARMYCSRTGQVLWYNEPQTGRLRTRFASSDRLWAYPYRAFNDSFRLPTVDRTGRVVGDMPVEQEP
ncbi:MAG: hypothetical protein ACTJH7_17775, partial [Alcaligenes sp.]